MSNQIKELNPALVAQVAASMKGAKLAKFMASIAIVNESLAQGSWISRGNIKAHSGFYQGLCKPHLDREKERTMISTPEWCAANGLSHTLSCGSVLSFMTPGGHRVAEGWTATKEEMIALGIKTLREHGNLKKISDELVYAWLELAAEFKAVVAALDVARPRPVVTPIGLSPKVTATLTQCNLDLDLPTIKAAEIAIRQVPGRHKKGPLRGQPMLDKAGVQIMVDEAYVKWTEGTLLDQSRFSSGCQACGKWIPSGRYVAIEVMDKKKGRIGMYLGQDCASNIFGVKDVGVSKPDKEEDHA